MDNYTYQILQILIEADNYVTYKFIAEAIYVSIRTVNRIIPQVVDYLDDNGINYKIKKGKGIRLVIDDIQRKLILKRIKNSKLSYLSQQERLILIIIELLNDNDYIKIDYFSLILGVSVSTIQNDIELVQEKISVNGLTLKKERGKGIQIVGNERKKILAKIDLIIENVNIQSIDHMSLQFLSNEVFLSNLSSAVKETLLRQCPLELLLRVKKELEEFDAELQYYLVSESYIKLLLIFAMLLQEGLHEERYIEEKNNELLFRNGYVQKIVSLQFWKNKVNISQNDVDYITNYLISARKTDRLDNKYENAFHNLVEVDESFILKEIYKHYQKEIDYSSDLQKILKTHLQLFIERYRSDMQAKNQYVSKNIIIEYPNIFNKIKTILENLGFEKVIDDEVAYISMHILGAILEKKNKKSKKKVALICMSGIGTSKVLKETLKNYFPNISVKNIDDISNINELELIKAGVDLIVSSIQVKTTFVPSVVVNAFLSEADIEKISSYLKIDSTHSNNNQLAIKKNEKLYIENKGRDADEIALIERITNSFYFDRQETFIGVKECIHYISKKIAPEDKYLDLEKKLIEREKYGSTVISKEGVLLLHCKMEDVIQLGLIQLQKNMEYQTLDGVEMINTIVIMIIPENYKSKAVNYFGSISASLVTNVNIIPIMKFGAKEEILNMIKEEMK